jgi:hypothetical protein
VAQEVRGNQTVRVKNESRGFHLNNLSYAGPIVMGVGGLYSHILYKCVSMCVCGVHCLLNGNVKYFGECPLLHKNLSLLSSGSKSKLRNHLSLQPVSAGFLLGLNFGPEEVRDLFFRNVGLSLK